MEKTSDALTQNKTPVPTQPPVGSSDDLPPGFFKTVDRMVERNKEKLKKLFNKE